MKQYLPDTNLWIRYIRDPASPIRTRLAAVPPTAVKFCSVTLSELYRGALRSNDPDGQRAVIDALAAPLDCLPFDCRAADIHANIRVHLERLGQPIGPHDLLIAATALANGLTVVTHNTKEFTRVPGLDVEDWEIP